MNSYANGAFNLPRSGRNPNERENNREQHDRLRQQRHKRDRDRRGVTQAPFGKNETERVGDRRSESDSLGQHEGRIAPAKLEYWRDGVMGF